MKKIEKLLLVIIGAVLLNFTVDVNAAAGAVLVDNGTDIYNVRDKAGKLRYVSQKQQISGVGAYCIDPGYSVAANLEAAGCDIDKISSSDFAKIESIIAQLNQINGANDYYYKQMLLRYWAMDTGLIKNKLKNDIWSNMKDYNLYLNADSDKNNESIAIIKNNVESFSHQYSLDGAGNFDFILQDTNTGDNSFSQTYQIIYTGNGQIKDWNSVNIELKNRSNGSIEISAKNGNIITISGNIIKCKGASFTLVASTDSDNIIGSSGANNTGGAYYYIDCGEGYQNYILDGKPDVDFGDDGGNPRDAEGKKNISIPDPECNCDATYSGDFVCDGSGTTTEYLHETDNILSCIISGGYKDYCGSGIQKETDNNGSRIKTSNLSDKVSDYTITLSRNDYCEVYCKEEIDYLLPGKIEVKNGRYFTLKDGIANDTLKLSGVRSCYTSEIKISDFEEDVKEAQNAVLTAYKNYKKAEARVKSQADYDSYQSSCTVNNICGNATGVSGTGEWYTGSEETYYYYTATFAEGGEISLTPASDTVKEEWGIKYTSTSTSPCNKGTTKKPNWQTGTSCSKIEVPKENINLNTYIAEVSQAQENLNEILKKYKSCYEWNNNYCFEPQIIFEYEDGEIYKEVNNKELKGNNTEYDSVEVNGQQAGEWGYNDVRNDTQYKENGEKIEDKMSSKKYVYFDVDSNSLDTQNVRVNLTQKYVKKVSTASKEFTRSSVKVCTYHTSGAIITGNECEDGENTITLGSDGYVFPVTLQKGESRQYNYELKFSNIGVDGDDGDFERNEPSSCTGGRLMGCKNGSLDVYSSVTNKKEAKYVCQYSSCPECKTECVCPEDNPDCYVEDEICYFPPDPNCPSCKPSCVGCLWSTDDIAFGYKQISLSDIFPNSNTNKVGYNWNTDPNINPQAEKVKETIIKIEEDRETGGEKIYAKPEYSYTLTPFTMGKIRKYNEEANKESASSVKWGNNDIFIPKGGYNNDTLICDNGAECKSTFLDGLDKIVGENNRVRNDIWTTKNGTAWK